MPGKSSMKEAEALIDSNILVDAFDASESAKRTKARTLLDNCFSGQISCAVSLQNLSEFYVTVTKKVSEPLSPFDAAEIVKKIMQFNGIRKLAVTENALLHALKMCTDDSMKYWDSLIAATMLEHSIYKVYTENTKDFKLKQLTVVNPFSQN